MLSFNQNTQAAQNLAVHYARVVGDQALIDFMSAKAGLDSNEIAEQIARSFWAITNLAIDDNKAKREFCGTCDLEFWMYQLFNKMTGYFSKLEYEEIWDRVENE